MVEGGGREGRPITTPGISPVQALREGVSVYPTGHLSCASAKGGGCPSTPWTSVPFQARNMLGLPPSIPERISCCGCSQRRDLKQRVDLFGQGPQLQQGKSGFALQAVCRYKVFIAIDLPAPSLEALAQSA